MFSVQVLLSGFLILGIGSSYGQELQCPSDYHYIAQKCYKFHQTKMIWREALSVCEKEGGHLASVLNDQQYNGLLDHMRTNYAGQYWLSGGCIGGAWIWTSEGASIPDKWWGKSPGMFDGCSYFCSLTNKYWSSRCSKSKRFVCELKTPCVPLILPPRPNPETPTIEDFDVRIGNV